MNAHSTKSIFMLFTISVASALAACSPSPQNPAAQPTASGSPAVKVVDQQFDGTHITVADAFSQGPGWLVIHSQENGALGPAIGEAHLNNGDNKNVVVTVDPSQETPLLYAMLHKDAGVVGTYEFPGPDEPVMVDGQMVSPAFKAPRANGADVLPSITVADQAVDSGQVTVASVVSSGPGWVSVNTQGSDGKPGAAIGYVAVKSGTSANVVVTIDPSKATPVLYAMLYMDAGQAGKFEVPGADMPQVAQGQPVYKSFATSPSVAANTPAAAATMVMAMDTPTANSGSSYGGSAGYPAANNPPVTGGTPGAPGLQPSITVADQAIQNGTVNVPLVVSNGNWWLVIHRQNPDGNMGSYIGEKLLTNGVHNNVVVNVDMNRVTSVLYAMLHQDLGVIGVLEFPGPDVPVPVNGQMAIPFNLTNFVHDVTINVRKLNNSLSILTDGDGRSVYIFLDDSIGKSTCTGACRSVWTPLLVNGKLIAGTGVSQSDLNVILLPEGSRQVTYKGFPLYTYTKDLKPGDTNGQGVDQKWLLVTP